MVYDQTIMFSETTLKLAKRLDDATGICKYFLLSVAKVTLSLSGSRLTKSVKHIFTNKKYLLAVCCSLCCFLFMFSDHETKSLVCKTHYKQLNYFFIRAPSPVRAVAGPTLTTLTAELKNNCPVYPRRSSYLSASHG